MRNEIDESFGKGWNQPFEIDMADRVRRLPAYLFAKINELMYQKRRSGAADAHCLRAPAARNHVPLTVFSNDS